MFLSIPAIVCITVLLVGNATAQYLNDDETRTEIQQRHKDDLDILPEYNVEKHVLYSTGTANSTAQNIVLYRITEGPKSVPNNANQPTLIQHGVICDAVRCTVNQPLIAIAYILVDHGYDVWLGASDPHAVKNLNSSEDAERAKLEPVAQYVLGVIQQPELSVIGYFNGSSKIFGVKAYSDTANEQSTISRFFNSIPGVKTVKKWYRKTINFVSNRFNDAIDTVNSRIDYVIDNLQINELQARVLTYWGSVSRMVAPTLSIDDFSNMIDHPDVHLTTPELVRKYSYEAETHRITTEDGYILTAHRITGGNRSPPKPGKPVVILQHGILSSSADWVILGPETSLGYILADEGYDVWMSNSRGNTYSKAHVNMSSTDHDFWQFSWHEMGVYDIPALIDYVLNVTERNTVSYIGHSQGVTQLLVALSEKPEYNSKIFVAIAFAPMAYAGNMRSPLMRVFARISTPIYHLFNLVGIKNFLPTNAFLTEIGREVCEMKSVIQVVCSNSLFLATGYDMTQLNLTMVPVILGHTPAGASTKQFVHYAQLHNSNKFRQFDYSLFSNRQIYNRDEPPEYNLQNVRVPMNIFYASNDLLADHRDVERLANELPNVEFKHKIALENFNHIDFMYGIDAPELVYQLVLKRLHPSWELANPNYNIDVRMRD